MSWMLWKKYVMKANICKQWTKVITIITHHHMVMHLRTIFQWSFAGFIWIIWLLGQSPVKVIMVRDTPPYGHAPTYQISLTYLERKKCYGPDKKILFKKQLTLRSRSHEGHYSMRHTTLWSCTHIPNIIDLSRKTKMLWSGQENTI